MRVAALVPAYQAAPYLGDVLALRYAMAHLVGRRAPPSVPFAVFATVCLCVLLCVLCELCG